jgi:hypothetical protein
MTPNSRSRLLNTARAGAAAIQLSPVKGSGSWLHGRRQPETTAMYRAVRVSEPSGWNDGESRVNVAVVDLHATRGRSNQAWRLAREMAPSSASLSTAASAP